MPDIVYRFLLFALIHSLLAMERAKEFLCRNRPARTRCYRLAYNLLALGSFAWVLAALAGSPVLYTLSGYQGGTLRAVQGCALILLCRCAAQTGPGEFLGIRQLLTTAEQPPFLTRKGCYGHVRHPQYTLAVIMLLAAPTMNVNYLLFTSLAILYFILGALVEESRLCRLFGEEYRRYRREIPMFLPTPLKKR